MRAPPNAGAVLAGRQAGTSYAVVVLATTVRSAPRSTVLEHVESAAYGACAATVAS